ncbi:MAG: septum formation initiator family protein [Bacteroidales bacterium]|nr:septum formation initiator family protein [Bacteroidales bacterium]MBR6162126.1 septum formation initiator family protein [Bacteroidales bacterium]MCR4738609.1 septum formation initiator family protein [Bacteroidales bacterium]
MEEEKKPNKRRRNFLLLYGGTLLAFLVYFFFFSSHSFKTHLSLDRKINNLEEKITSTKNQVGNVYTFEQLNNDSTLLEKYAREHLNMHRADEDVFIIIHE